MNSFFIALLSSVGHYEGSIGTAENLVGSETAFKLNNVTKSLCLGKLLTANAV
jgi:hypothetical protein